MKYENVDRLLQSFVDQGLPGCTLHIAQHGKTLYEGCFGYADVENKVKMTPSNVFRMASMSKLPLYTTLMVLYERGLLVMDDPISKYFPEWKTSKKVVRDADGTERAVSTDRPVLVKDVMTMACGLPYCFPAMKDSKNFTERSMASCLAPLWDKGSYGLREEIRALSEAVLAFEPGTHWMYGYSSELAAGLIEAICDKPANDAFADILFKPLGMTDTAPHYFGDIRERMVRLYAQKPDGTFALTSTDMDLKHEPGEENQKGNPRLFSTGRDYTRLMQMLACGGELDGVRIMGRKTIDLMRTNTLNEQQMRDFTDDYNKGYGYGYGVRTLIDKSLGNNNGSFGAFGWTGGFGTWCEADPEDGVSIVFMQNLFPALDNNIHGQIRTVSYSMIE